MGLRINTSCKGIFGSIINFNGGSKFGKNKIAQLVSKSGISVKALSGISEDGFAKLNSKSTSLIFDMGAPNKDTLNWHAGTLSFEFSHGKNLILVNNGFFVLTNKTKKLLLFSCQHNQNISVIFKDLKSSVVHQRVILSNIKFSIIGIYKIHR